MAGSKVEIRVRYQETDRMGIVYYANYLVWFEIARTELFRSLGMDYCRLEQEDNIFLPVTEAFCKYKKPIKYDDKVTVLVGISEIKKARIIFEYTVKRSGELCAEGRTSHTFVDPEGRPIGIPEKVRSLIVSAVP